MKLQIFKINNYLPISEVIDWFLKLLVEIADHLKVYSYK
jgi:hypothetical protein